MSIPKVDQIKVLIYPTIPVQLKAGKPEMLKEIKAIFSEVVQMRIADKRDPHFKSILTGRIDQLEDLRNRMILDSDKVIAELSKQPASQEVSNAMEAERRNYQNQRLVEQLIDYLNGVKEKEFGSSRQTNLLPTLASCVGFGTAAALLMEIISFQKRYDSWLFRLADAIARNRELDHCLSEHPSLKINTVNILVMSAAAAAVVAVAANLMHRTVESQEEKIRQKIKSLGV